MIQPTISYLTDVYFGFGVSDVVPDLLAAYGIRRPLLVTDPGLSDLGIAKRVCLHDAPVYSGVKTNPSEPQVLDALEVYRTGRCDGLVAVGGGSSIDLAKCAGILVGHNGPLESYALRRGGTERITRRIPPIVAVPTTAGSGERGWQGRAGDVGIRRQGGNPEPLSDTRGRGVRSGTDADNAACPERRHGYGRDFTLRGDVLQHTIQPRCRRDRARRTATRLSSHCNRVW